MSFTPGRSNDVMHEYFLRNGLRVLLVPRTGLSVCTANVTYGVGSRNEGLLVTGSTHYLEHGMFKGSKKYQGKNGMWKLEQRGAYMNATTYTDRTNYFEVLQTEDLESALLREGDRMLEPLLTEELLKSEMSVVRNEMERGDNNSFEVLHKELLASAFIAHPYHHSTIGWKSDVEHVSAKALRKFHDTYYTPRNASLTIVGSFDAEKVKDLIVKSFGHIPKGKAPPTMYTTEPEQWGQRRIEVRRPSRTALMGIAFKSVNGLHSDSIVLEVLAKLLSNGPNSPFEGIKKQSIVHDVMPSWERMRDPYIFNMYVTTNSATESAMKNAEDSVIKILQSDFEILDSTLELAKKTIKYSWEEAMSSTRGMASEVNEAIARGNPYDVFDRFDVLKSVTLKDIRRVCRETFVLNKSTVGWYMPQKEQPLKKDLTLKYVSKEYPSAPAIERLPKFNASKLNIEGNSRRNDLSVVTKYKTGKSYIHVSLESDKTSFTAKSIMARRLLTELMSKGVRIKQKVFNELNVQSFLEENGIDRTIYPSARGVSMVFSTCVTDEKVNKQTVLLMENELKSPSLEAETFNYLKQKLSAELAGSSGNVNNEADRLLSQSLFEKGDPNYTFSSETLCNALLSLTHEDILEEHSRLIAYGVMRTSVLSNVDALMNFAPARFRTNTNNALGEEKNLLNSPNVGAHSEINIAGKSSCTVKWAHVISNPSIATKLAIGALGGGFSGRLMQIIRDKQGLTYGIYSSQRKLHGQSVFETSATFNPQNLKRGIEESEKVMREWKKGITDEEIDIQRSILIGSQIVHWDDCSNISAEIHKTLVSGDSLKSIDDFKETVNNVTYADVRKALNEELHVDKLKRAVAGTLL